ncbi:MULTISPECIES: DUF937 domain-containing protein [Microbacterium]|uniref:DUF937 domain-containing protein n=1 Tax=Microbacterium TaxID=33882 RepID=UPI00217D40C9|nr:MULTISPECIES: DUF937 domain-containing protein [Microbacterium]UWF77753.1 DUF937 domain-containing protein [Microbacterium neungamense]WCM55919.1 DUF937 domain-containing protein [Microbacterium sp. EF45047]
MNLDEILKQVPIDDIAQRFGVSQDVARQAVAEGSAALLGGLQKNAETPEGSSAIEQALNRHEGFSGASSVDDVDREDGEKIVKHVFGDKKKDVEETLTTSEKTAGGIDFGKLLPILAPIILGLIANATKGKGGSTAGSSSEAGSGGGLGDILGGLGGLLGGGSGSTGSGSSGGIGGVVGDILGGLFGGRR